jgi:hypothetical protein
MSAAVEIQGTMKLHLDELLQECVWDACATARREQPSSKEQRTAVVVRMLYELEGAGYAMRYRAPHGGIAWKAAPRMLDLLADAEAEARADLQHEREAIGVVSDD